MIIDGIDKILRPGSLVLLGEVHGTRQAAEAVLALALHAARSGPVRVGVEFPQSEQSRIDAFFGSGATLVDGPFWRSQDQYGVTTVAMAALLTELRRLREHADIAVFAFDSSEEARDENMAKHILAVRRAAPDATMLVLSGNLHTRTRGTEPYVPMGAFLVEQEPVIALDLSYRTGTTWNVTMTSSTATPQAGMHSVCGEDHGDAPHVRMFGSRDERGYDGELYLGDVDASPPAMNEPRSNVEPATIAELSRLADDAANRPDDRDLHLRLVWLVDLLIARGHLAPGHRKLIGKLRDPGARVRLNLVDDKRSQASPDIDCAANLPLCHGRCCSFSVSLSPEDLDEGKLRWALEDPYVLRRDAQTGYCENLDAAGACAVYDDRPAICRSYDCREDRRVWLDYEARVPAPMPASVIPLRT